MISKAEVPTFDGALGCLVSPVMARLATQLANLSGLGASERDVLLAAAQTTLQASLHRKLARLLVLELNGARLLNKLDGEGAEERWRHFLDISATPEFWAELTEPYPGLDAKLARILDNGSAAVLEFAERWASCRDDLAAFCGAAPGALKSIAFGSGDTHCGGRTVALIQAENCRLVYKPRPLAPERLLRDFLRALEARAGVALFAGVPRVLDCGGYGWAEFVAHRHADGADELRRFYRGIGQWLAIMRLLGGTDLHAENLIASGAVPFVVDCETLFSPKRPAPPSGLGGATDKAARLVAGTVLATGLLPCRNQGPGWRGADVSGAGGLAGQQPDIAVPDLVGAGTDVARIGLKTVKAEAAQNQPSSEPTLAEHWPDVLNGFDQVSTALRALDAQGGLEELLAPFGDCTVRIVVRSTASYAELMRMLWHPVSLHGAEKAREHCHRLLSAQAERSGTAPRDPAIIDTEIDALIAGDIPYFATVARDSSLIGPSGAAWLAPGNLVRDAVENWRHADLDTERNYVRAAIVNAYVADGWKPPPVSFRPAQDREGDLDRRRREQAAQIVRTLVATAITGDDGTATWMAPMLTPNGWAVQPLGPDLYTGLSGIAVLTGAYLRELAAGRADAVDGVQDLHARLLRSLAMVEDTRERSRRKGLKLRPLPPGSYVGLGSQIWARLLLAQWNLDEGDGRARAVRLAEEMPAAIAADEIQDVLSGRSGAIVPLLALARATGDGRFVEIARSAGDLLCATAKRDARGAFWTHPQWPAGVGGYSHGVTGIGWALLKLADATGDARYRDVAAEAFAFEDSLYDPARGQWRDLRQPGLDGVADAWCHGSIGIGLARLDLDPGLETAAARDAVARAAAAAWRDGFGWNHCACHGDLGAWEMVDRALAKGVGPAGLTRERLLACVLTSIEDEGPACGVLSGTAVPGLLPGLGGIAYQLLRAGSGAALPSIMTLPESFAAAERAARQPRFLASLS
ncbi:MAG TPA: type 2 lanthipeptide synthetase LanM family protein [Rhizomicrobium sp.]|nr:type 2 lanthipeptide synthetase LanM family protein [Rhizomicrobium sp.]